MAAVAAGLIDGDLLEAADQVGGAFQVADCRRLVKWGSTVVVEPHCHWSEGFQE
jgi:hypothetical protein